MHLVSFINNRKAINKNNLYMTTLFLTVHTRYKDVLYGLFENEKLIASTQQEHKQVSAFFPACIEDLLHAHNLHLSDVSFIAAHQGPAPFTTLRVSLTFLNGISFAKHISLIGVDGLYTFVQEHKNNQYDYTLALLNAFCDDVYYGLLNNKTGEFTKGSARAQLYIQEISKTLNGSIYCIGNGVTLYKQIIENSMQVQAVIPEIVPEMVSLEAVGLRAFEQWQIKENIQKQLMPLYLKAYTVSSC